MLDVAEVAPVDAMPSAYAPALLMLVFEKVTMPFAADTAVVPASVPPARLLASDSVTEPLNVVTTAPAPFRNSATGPGVMVAYHAFLEQRDARLDHFPNAKRFLELANAIDPGQRHLALHAGHLTELNSIDLQVITGEAMSIAPLVCKAAELPERLANLAKQGITEVAFQPMGDVKRELTAFARAAGMRQAA